jgi:tRNA (cmo5U34)-methyltransferase
MFYERKSKEMKTDEIYKSESMKSTDFAFDSRVVDVFDDMVIRSVPYYPEFQRMIAEIAASFAKPGSTIYDLGCSTGTTFLTLDQGIDSSVKFTGVDESTEMLEKCALNLEQNGVNRKYSLFAADLNHEVTIVNASVVILCLTLQFVRPLNRAKLIKSIYDQLNPGGIIILVEKVLCESAEFNRRFINYYYDFKRRNSYNELEIAIKREALENVLVPYKVSENIKMLGDAHFKSNEVFFKWYNFAGFVGIK